MSPAVPSVMFCSSSSWTCSWTLNCLRMSYYLPGVINVSCCPLSDVLFILLLHLLLELQTLKSNQGTHFLSDKNAKGDERGTNGINRKKNLSQVKNS